VGELDAARQTLSDAHTQLVATAAELEQLRKERDELRGGLQTATREHDAALQEREVAVQECDGAVQERDAVLAGAEEVSKREEAALASLQGAFLASVLSTSQLPSAP